MSDVKYNLTDLQEPVAQELKQSPLFRTVYSNAARLAYTPWDVRITYSQLTDVSEKGAVIQDEICVVMSPQHAKVLMAMWRDTILQYEGKFGAVPDLRDASKAFVSPATDEAKQQKSPKKRRISNVP